MWKTRGVPKDSREVIIFASFRNVRFDTLSAGFDIGWYNPQSQTWHSKSTHLSRTRELIRVAKWDYMPGDDESIEKLDNNTLKQTIEVSKYIVDESDVTSYKAGWNAALEQIGKWIGVS